MGYKILVAFDESENAKRAVNYVAQVFPRDAEITLFSVLQDSTAICEMNSPDIGPGRSWGRTKVEQWQLGHWLKSKAVFRPLNAHFNIEKLHLKKNLACCDTGDCFFLKRLFRC